jgi:hypothetical protein
MFSTLIPWWSEIYQINDTTLVLSIELHPGKLEYPAFKCPLGSPPHYWIPFKEAREELLKILLVLKSVRHPTERGHLLLHEGRICLLIGLMPH